MSNSTKHNDPSVGTQKDGQKDADKNSRDQSQQGGGKQSGGKQGGSSQGGSHGGSADTNERQQGGRGS